MWHSRSWYNLALFPILSGSIVLSVFGTAIQTIAQPAEVFIPHLDRIRQTLPPKYSMRLPSAVLLGGPADEDFIKELKVRIFASEVAPGVVVGLYACEDPAQFCLVGTYSVTSARSAIGQRQFADHVAGSMPITLTPTVRGYLLEGERQWPRSTFSSLMWRQDGMMYRIRFAYPERQNMLFMAKSMAESQALVSLNPEFREPPLEGNR